MSDASGRKSAARSGAGKTLRGHDARYLEKAAGCRSCKPAGIDERMKYFEQRGSLKAGKIRKNRKKGGIVDTRTQTAVSEGNM